MKKKTEKIYHITGGKPLSGEVIISGAKNAALPILAATLLSDEPIRLKNLPQITDVENMLYCMQSLGKKISYSSDGLLLMHQKINELIIPAERAQKIRGSILFLGPLLARNASVTLPLPGGCSIGQRPIDLHLKALAEFGVDIIEQTDALICTRRYSRLKASNIHFDKTTVTGSENAIMAAVLADGISMLHNVAIEPEVIDLIHFLNQMGASIKGIGTRILEITGVDKLHGCGQYSIISDRIEAGTYLVAAAITQGCVLVKGVNPQHLTVIVDVLRSAGAQINCSSDSIQIDMRTGETRAINVVTEPFPGFPTDMQSTFMSLATILNGRSSVCETMFENRFRLIKELHKMGAEITINGNTAQVSGVSHLNAAKVEATDLRSGAALICSALAAKGITQLEGVHYIERGYESIIEKLQALGAHITIRSTISASEIGMFKKQSGFKQISANTAGLIP